MEKIEVEIKGETPYLMHAFSMEESMKKGKKKTTDIEPETQAESSLYKLPDGTIYVPSTQIHGCLIEAGKKFRVVGQGKATYSKLIGGLVMINPDSLEMTPQKYEIDSRAVVVPATRGRIVRHRPKFIEWSLKFEIHNLEPDQIPLEELKRILDYAGSYVGIGDFRPGKKGPFGRFIVTKFKTVKKS